MGFNTFDFLIFFPAVVLVYWLLPGRGRWRNTFLLVASYYFYMNWEPAYALLIAFSSVTTWLCGVAMERLQISRLFRRHHRAEHEGSGRGHARAAV